MDLNEIGYEGVDWIHSGPVADSSISEVKNIHTELLGFWTLSIVRILLVTRKKKNKHDVSETGSVSVLR
jgi:hypothetical protein